MSDLESRPRPPSLVPISPRAAAVEDLLQPYRKLVTRLRRSDTVKHGDVDAAFRQITELAAQVLDVPRASVWRLTQEGQQIECVDMFVRHEAGDGSHIKDIVLGKSSAQSYFEALDAERCIIAHDASNDPRTASLKGYLEAHSIGAMLDAPVFLHGSMVGVLCHEHVGGPREWEIWEELVAGTLADFIALVMEAGERVRAEAEVARVREHLEQELAMRAVFEAAPVPLVLARADGRIESWNPRAIDVIGVPSGVDPHTIEAARFYASAEDRERVLAQVRETGAVDDHEILMQTWSGEPRWCLASLRTLDYRGKPHVLMGFSDISTQKDIERKLRDAATRDPLTGLHNRRHFFEAAARELERAKRYRRPLSLAMLDADHFKSKNDEHGHLVGDDLLVGFAHVAAAALRQSDIVARFGGEELVMVYPETDLDAAYAVTERIRLDLKARQFNTLSGPIGLTCSAGVVAYDGAESLSQLIDRADQALYTAKANGRDCVRRG